MKYTHYIPTPSGPERGNIIKLPSTALQSAGKFEDAIGQMVSKFSRHFIDDSRFREEVTVELSDGTRLRFNITMGASFPTVFLSENGRYTAVTYKNPPSRCANHPENRYRVVFDEHNCTKFISYIDAFNILEEIAIGHGAIFDSERSGRRTVLPHHAIKKAAITEAPFGGHS